MARIRISLSRRVTVLRIPAVVFMSFALSTFRQEREQLAAFTKPGLGKSPEIRLNI